MQQGETFCNFCGEVITDAWAVKAEHLLTVHPDYAARRLNQAAIFSALNQMLIGIGWSLAGLILRDNGAKSGPAA
jgi:hypothetical protein